VDEYICARCRQSNKRWHEWANAGSATHFSRFFLRSLPWGWLAVLSLLLPPFAARFVNFTPVASERIGISLAVLLIFVNVALLYALKESLWRYDLLARVGRGLRPPLALFAIITFVLGLICGLVIVFLLEAREAVPGRGPTEGLELVVNTLVLAFTFVNIALSATFMAAHDYSNWLNREMPQPIYAQERRLWKVIEDSIQERIRQTTSKDVRVETIITDLERNVDGGITVLINAETSANQPSVQGTLKELQSWRVTADRWGRILKMAAEGIPRYLTIEKVTSQNGLAVVEEVNTKNSLENSRPKPVTGDIIFPEDHG
jgi:hypothetical protein